MEVQTISIHFTGNSVCAQLIGGSWRARRKRASAVSDRHATMETLDVLWYNVVNRPVVARLLARLIGIAFRIMEKLRSLSCERTISPKTITVQ
jgi:hypothetical protein